MAKSRRISAPPGWRAQRASWPDAAHAPNPSPSSAAAESPGPIHQAQQVLCRLQAAARAADAEPLPPRLVAHDLDASMQRIGQLNRTISLLEHLRELLRSSFQ